MPVEDFFYHGYARIEIPKKVLIAVWRRVYDRTRSPSCPDGDSMKIQCEKCGLVLGKKKFEYDHKNPEAFQMLPPAEREKITADDVWLIGLDCCHKPKSAKERGQIAKTKRLSRKEARAEKPKRSRWLSSKDGPYKAKVGGGWEKREK